MLWAFFDNKGVCFGAYKTQFQQPRQAFSAPLPGSVTGAPHPPSHYTHTFTHMYMLNEYKKQSKWPKMEPTMKKYRARTYARTAEWLQLSNPSRHKIWISSHKYPSGWLLARSLSRSLFLVLREKLRELVEHQKLWRGSRNLLPD